MSAPGLFGTRNRTNILLYLTLLEESHAAELARLIDTSLSNTQKTIDSLERVGVVSGAVIGRERRIALDPRYFAYQELRSLLDKMVLANPEIIHRAIGLRRRPRRSGKSL